MATVKIFGKENGVAILLPSGKFIYGDPDGDFVAENGTASDEISIKRSVNNFFVVRDLVHTSVKDKDGGAIAANRDAVVTALNNNFFNRGSSLNEIGDLVEDASIDKTQGKKLHLVMDSSSRFVLTNVANTQVDNALLSSEVLSNGNAKIKLTKTQSNGITGIDSVNIIKGTGITLGTQGGNITISGFSGNYSDLSGAPSLGAVATSNDYNDLTNLPTIPTDTNTNIGNTDMTLSGARSVNMNGNDLFFKDGLISKLQYDDSEDEWTFNAPVRFDKSTGGEIKLREPSSGGVSGVILKAPNTNLASDLTFTLPSADGSNGEVLKTNGSGALSFSSALDGDPTLQAASTADLNGEDFTINVNGGNFFVKEASSTRIQVDQTDVVIQGLTFPSSDGSAGQVLKTNGSGALSFVNQTTDTNTQLTTEEVQDIVGAMFTSNTETRISATYEDSDGTIDLVVDDMTADTNTSLADTDQTLTAGRTINVDSNDLFIKDGFNTKLQFDASADEFLFTAPVRFDGGNAGGFIKLRETVQGGTEGVILRAPAGNMTGDVEFRLPGQDGTSGQFMRTDGSGNLSFSVPTDTNTSLSDTDQTLAAARTVNMNGNDLNFKDGTTSKLLYDDSADEWIFNTAVRFDQSTTGGEIKLRESVMGGDSGVILRAPSSNLASDVVFRMPAADGSAGQFIKTDGSGNLSFGSAGSSSTIKWFIAGGAQVAFPFARYLPLTGDVIEQNTASSALSRTGFVAPYDGEVKKVMFRSQETLGNTELRWYKATDGTHGPATSLQTVTIDYDTANQTETYTYSTVTFSKGDVLSLRWDPTSDPVSSTCELNYTVEFEFDTST